jgi:hypothetical protein
LAPRASPLAEELRVFRQQDLSLDAYIGAHSSLMRRMGFEPRKLLPANPSQSLGLAFNPGDAANFGAEIAPPQRRVPHCPVAANNYFRNQFIRGLQHGKLAGKVREARAPCHGPRRHLRTHSRSIGGRLQRRPHRRPHAQQLPPSRSRTGI